MIYAVPTPAMKTAITSQIAPMIIAAGIAARDTFTRSVTHSRNEMSIPVITVPLAPTRVRMGADSARRMGAVSLFRASSGSDSAATVVSSDISVLHFRQMFRTAGFSAAHSGQTRTGVVTGGLQGSGSHLTYTDTPGGESCAHAHSATPGGIYGAA